MAWIVQQESPECCSGDSPQLSLDMLLWSRIQQREVLVTFFFESCDRSRQILQIIQNTFGELVSSQLATIDESGILLHLALIACPTVKYNDALGPVVTLLVATPSLLPDLIEQFTECFPVEKWFARCSLSQ